MRLLAFHKANADSRFRCFGCCHVQTGAICLGIYHLVLELISVTILTYFILDPDFINLGRKDNVNNFNNSERVMGQKLTFPIDNFAASKIQGSFIVKSSSNSSSKTNDINSDLGGPEPLPTPIPRIEINVDAVGVVTSTVSSFLDKTSQFLPNGMGNQFTLMMLLGLMIITLMMIYGAIKAKHLFILPYFGYQVFDFAITSLMAVSYYSWIPNANDFVNNNPDFPLAQTLSKYDLQWIGLLVLLVYVVVLLVKAYCIGVTFACYQYCQLRSSGVLMIQEDANCARTVSELLPPTYENAVKMQPCCPDEETPPPPYRSV